jgi:predicted Rossmann-fold nucleotide-binding protein
MGYPNAFVEVPILTHLPGGGVNISDPLTRNHINVLSSDFLVFLPGGPGTALEAALALAYGKPMYELNRAEQFPELTAVLQKYSPLHKRDLP